MHIIQEIPTTVGLGSSQVIRTSMGPGGYLGSIQVVPVVGAATFNIEFSNDGVTWHAYNSGLQAPVFDNLTTLGPPVYIRLNVTDDTGSASVKAFIHEVV